MPPRVEEVDPTLLRCIRQLAREGLDRVSICAELQRQGYRIDIVRVRQIIHRRHIPVAPHQRRVPSALEAAKNALAREIAEAVEAKPSVLPFKSGGLEW